MEFITNENILKGAGVSTHAMLGLASLATVPRMQLGVICLVLFNNIQCLSCFYYFVAAGLNWSDQMKFYSRTTMTKKNNK